VIAPLAVSVADAGKALGISRTFAYELVNDGTIRTIELGRRRLVPVVELERLVTDLLAVADVERFVADGRISTADPRTDEDNAAEKAGGNAHRATSTV
jgi:excisionase family DNA binding protein